MPYLFIVHEQDHGDISYWLSRARAIEEVVHSHQDAGCLIAPSGEETSFPDWWACATTDQKYEFLEREGYTDVCGLKVVPLNTSWR